MIKKLVFHNNGGKLRKKFVNCPKGFIHTNVDKVDNLVENIRLYIKIPRKRERIIQNLGITL